MQNSATTWAIVPIKEFSKAKSRLNQVLQPEQCTALAEYMAADVVRALHDATLVDGITLLGTTQDTAGFAQRHDCEFIKDTEGDGLSSNLNRAAAALESRHVGTLLFLPVDLPMLSGNDIDTLLRNHAGGLTVCPAVRDAGTNALVITPPHAIPFRFGDESAQRHVAEGKAAGLHCQLITDGPFSRDIDRPDDLLWFCREHTSGRSSDYLDSSGIRARLLADNEAASA